MIFNKKYVEFCIKQIYKSLSGWARASGFTPRMACYYINKRMNPLVLTDLIIDLELDPRDIFIKKEGIEKEIRNE